MAVGAHLLVLVVLMVGACAGEGDWTFPTHTPAPFDYNAVTYSQDHFLVVGSYSGILSSEDGESWSLLPSPELLEYSTFQFVSGAGPNTYVWSNAQEGGEHCIRSEKPQSRVSWTFADAPIRSTASSGVANIATGVNADSIWIEGAQSGSWSELILEDPTRKAVRGEQDPVEDDPVEEPVEDEPVEDEPMEDEPMEDEPMDDDPEEDDGAVKAVLYDDVVYASGRDEFAVVGVHITRHGDDIVTNMTRTFVYFGTPDAKDWKAVEIQQSGCNSRTPKLSYSPSAGRYVLLGCGRLLSSEDGVTWDDADCGDQCDELPSSVVLSLACSGTDGRCVALGGVSSRAGADTKGEQSEGEDIRGCVIMESGDGGLTWGLTESCGELASLETGPHSAAVATDGSGVFVIANRELLMSSSQSGAWIQRMSVIQPEVDDVQYEPSLDMLIATSTFQNGFLSSANGKDWIATSTPFQFRGILSFNNMLIGVTTDGTRNYVRATDVSNLGVPEAPWEVVLGDEQNSAYHSLQIHEPTNTLIIYGVANDEAAPYTTLYSTVNGRVWNHTKLDVNPLAVNWMDSENAFISFVREDHRSLGSFRSSKDGIKWKEKLGTVNSECPSIAVNSKHVVALCACGTLYSDDFGKTWQTPKASLPYDSQDSFPGLTRVSYLPSLDVFAISGSPVAAKTSNALYFAQVPSTWEQLEYPYTMPVLAAAFHGESSTLAVVANKAISATTEQFTLTMLEKSAGTCNVTMVVNADDSPTSSDTTRTSEEESSSHGTVVLTTSDIVLIVLVVFLTAFLIVGAIVSVVLHQRRKKEQSRRAWTYSDEHVTDALMENVDF